MTSWACACGNPKQLEVVAPTLAKLRYSWPGHRGLGQQPPSPSAPSSSRASTHTRAAAQAAGQTLWAGTWGGCSEIAKKGAKLGREGGPVKTSIAY